MTRTDSDDTTGPVCRIGVVVRDGDQARPILEDLIEKGSPLGLEFLIEPSGEDWAPDGLQRYEGPDQVDGVVSLGGDGTLLRAARDLIGTDVPLLGINLGHLGFLTHAGVDELESVLSRLASGEYEVEKRLTLRVDALGDDAPDITHPALNEVVVNRAGVARVIRLELFVGSAGEEEEVGSFSGDGVLVATPTGSTAYSLSAGGPIVEPSVDCLTVTPICPHTLAVRPLILPPHLSVRIRSAEPDPDMMVTLDGQEGISVPAEGIRVRRAEETLNLIRFPGQTFFGTLRRKLRWAARPGSED